MTQVAPTKEPKTSAASKQQPLFKNKLGNISVTVFTDEVTRQDGTSFTAANFALQKSWQDAKSDWQDATIYLKRREILPILLALQEAYMASFNLGSNESAEEQ